MVATCNLHLHSRNHGVQTKINKCICSKECRGCYINPIRWALISLIILSVKQQLWAWFDSYWKSLELADFNAPFINGDQINNKKRHSSVAKLKHRGADYSVQLWIKLLLWAAISYNIGKQNVPLSKKYHHKNLCSIWHNNTQEQFPRLPLLSSSLHPLWYTHHDPSTAQSSKSGLTGWQINNRPSQSRGFSQLHFSTLHKLLSVHSWLNCPCSPVTQRSWAEAITRDLNEVVNFELTPFRVTDDVNMCCEFRESCNSCKESRVTSDMCNTS